VSIESITVQVCLFAFDLLYLNGQSLLKETFSDRRKKLHILFTPLEGHFQFAKFMDSESVEDIQTFLEESIKDGCEGLMIKTLEAESSYEPSKRSRNWLKVKKDYLSGTGDSLDLVVIGAYYGRGKRTGVYGGYLLACYDEENEMYQAICKIGTGFSEADLAQQEVEFKDMIIPNAKAYYQVTDGIKPDVWLDAVKVWEVKAADFSISPIYTAAIGVIDKSKGVSLRFPRFIRVREDKTPEQATPSSLIADLYKSQILINQDNKGSFIDEDDY
jgi:DNA ligase 1